MKKSNKKIVKGNFLPGLYKSLDYIRGYVASNVIFDMLQSGVFQLLEEGRSVKYICKKKKFDPYLLETVFEYLVIEDILKKRKKSNGSVYYVLTNYGKNIEKYKGWFNMLIGGYAPIFSNVGNMLEKGVDSVSRIGKWVGTGSCQISYYDSIPLMKDLIKKVNSNARLFVDFGCGNALYLCAFCEKMKNVKAIGIEPDKGSYGEGLKLIKKRGLGDQIKLVNCDALKYKIVENPDFVMFGFVLHEIYAQIGEKGLIKFISKLGKKFKDSYLLIVEVDYDIDNHKIMKSPMGLGYYNLYYMLHPFTNQKLLSQKKWDEIFSKARFKIVEKKVVDPKVDPSGLEIGYVLKYVE